MINYRILVHGNFFKSKFLRASKKIVQKLCLYDKAERLPMAPYGSYLIKNLIFSVVFFRDSLLITIILIVNTIIVQGMLAFDTQIPNWIEKTTSYMGSNRVGQLFLTKHLVANVRYSEQINELIGNNSLNFIHIRILHHH